MKKSIKNNKTIKRNAVFTVILLFFLLLTGSGDNYLARNLYVTALVSDPEAAAESVAARAEKDGGYFLLKSSCQVILRLPQERLPAFTEFLETVSEDIVELIPESYDLREEILALESRIKSREEILVKNLSYIDRADISGTLEIEREVSLLMDEIEGFKGRLRKLNADRRLAYVVVDFSFLSQSVPEDIPSSFSWINTVDFYSLMAEGLR